MMPLYLAIDRGRHLGDRDPADAWSAIAIAGFAWPLCLLLWFAFHPEVIVETLSRYGLDRSVAMPWPVGAPLGVGARHDVADGAAVRPGLAVLVVLRSGLPLPDGRLCQRRQFDAPRRRVSDVVPGADPDRHRRARLAAASVVDALVLAVFASAPLAACSRCLSRTPSIGSSAAPFGVLLAVAGAASSSTAPSRPWRHRRRAAARGRSSTSCSSAWTTIETIRGGRLLVQLEFTRGDRAPDCARTAMAPAAIYLSSHHVSNLDAYWRLYLSQYGRRSFAAHRAVRLGRISMCSRSRGKPPAGGT